MPGGFYVQKQEEGTVLQGQTELQFLETLAIVDGRKGERQVETCLSPSVQTGKPKPKGQRSFITAEGFMGNVIFIWRNIQFYLHERQPLITDLISFYGL